MPIAPFLALNNRTGTPQVRRYVNATPTPIGVSIPGAVIDTESGGDVSRARGYPAVIKFGGSQTFLAVTGLSVYRTTDGGATWATVLTLTGTHIDTGATIAKSGLFVLHVNGVATACLVTNNRGNGNFFAFTSTNGTSWTTLGPFASGFSDREHPTDSVVHDGRLITTWTGGGNTTGLSSIFDPVAGTMTFATFATAQGNTMNLGGALCVFNDRVFSLTQEASASGHTILKELVAGVWVLIGTDIIAGNSDFQTSKLCLFVDGTDMVGFVPKASSWDAYKWDAAMTRTNITTLVVPTALASGLANTQRMSVIVDERATPGTAPTIWLYQSTDGSAGASQNQWAWNGVSSFIGTLPGSAASGSDDSGGSARDDLPYVKHAQGSTFWTSTEDYIEEVARSPVVGGLLISFKLYSDGGVGTASVRAWYGVANDEYPLSAATLTGTTTGLAKDNTTVHQVTWQAQTDGFSSGQKAKFVLEKF